MDKEDRIVIRCSHATHRRWRRLVADMDVSSYEEALLKLIEIYEKNKAINVSW